jgi:glycosyltransferase involved in cell wall biosynthesis
VFCSIIVPTYNSDKERLGELVASLDAQTLSPDRFEVIFVDDGSTTDILVTLEEIAAARSNVRVIPMENSGWACRPRNEGTRNAIGDWVLYMDHDDILFPEALERLEAFSVGLEADVINPREVRTKNWSWGWDSFTGDIENVNDRGPLAFLPMTPHKLYRRAFLVENKIEFIEERRVLWEDVFFNVLAYSKGARISVFSSYPVYHWVQTGNNTSGTFGHDRDEMWRTIRTLIGFFNVVLTDQTDIDALTTHWFKSRVLKFIGPDSLDREPAVFANDFEHARALTLELIPETIDEGLDPVNRLRARLLRDGNIDSLRQVAVDDETYDIREIASDFAWDGSAVTFRLEPEFLIGDTELELTLDGDAVLYALPGVPESGAGVDIATALAKSVTQISARGVTTRESTKLDSATSLGLEKSGDTARVVAPMTARVDLDELLHNRALMRQRWDIAARTTFPSHTTHRAVRMPDENYVELHAIINGHQIGVHRGKETQLTISVDTDAASLVALFEREVTPATVRTRGSLTSLTVDVPDLHVVGDLSGISIEIALTPVGDDDEPIEGARVKLSGSLVKTAEGAQIVTEPAPVARGRYRTTVFVDSSKRRIAVTEVAKTPAQRVVGYIQQRRRG